MGRRRGVSAVFEDVEVLAPGCRFSDCLHDSEPGCAVRHAVEDGTITAERLANYLKLQDEMRDLDARKDVRARIDEKRKVKTVSQSLKKLYKSRDRE